MNTYTVNPDVATWDVATLEENLAAIDALLAEIDNPPTVLTDFRTEVYSNLASLTAHEPTLNYAY